MYILLTVKFIYESYTYNKNTLFLSSYIDTLYNEKKNLLSYIYLKLRIKL